MGPFVLKQLIEKNKSISTSIIDQLQQPMVLEQKLNYAQSIKNLFAHNLNVTPISYGLIPVVTNAWPSSMSGSLGIDQNSSFSEFGTTPQIAKTHKFHRPNLNESHWRASNILPQTYQYSEEWTDKDVFAIANAPRRQTSPLNISRMMPSCIYSNVHLEQPVMNFYPFRRERYQNIYQTFEKKYEKIEVKKDIKQQSNNNIYQEQVWHFFTIIYLIFILY